MKQRAFNFGHTHRRLVIGDPEWPFIISQNPERYPAILRKAAAMALHRLDRPHPIELCLLCERENRRTAA
jgi:hypothetical protein